MIIWLHDGACIATHILRRGLDIVTASEQATKTKPTSNFTTAADVALHAIESTARPQCSYTTATHNHTHSKACRRA